MAKADQEPHHLAAAMLILFAFLIMFFPSSSSARLLNVPQNLAANEQALYLVLPGDNAVVVAYPLEKDSERVLPCEMDESSKPKAPFPAAPRLAGKYGPLLLTRLPKGPMPKSGPSKGTNSVHN